MADNSQEALTELLQSLQTLEASDLVENITNVIARGATEDAGQQAKLRERVQRPLRD
jgi:hypothetical protein